jgi:cation diffusion facilitator family transporter
LVYKRLKPADKEHPYGHGEVESLAALVISLRLLLAAVIIMKERIVNIATPHKSPAAYTLIILIVVMVVKELLPRFVHKTGHETQSHGVKADAFHHRSDAIVSAAAFIGISVELIGKGYENADDYAALIASSIILINAYKIARSAIDELMDAAPDNQFTEQIKSLAVKIQGVMAIEKQISGKQIALIL